MRIHPLSMVRPAMNGPSMSGLPRAQLEYWTFVPSYHFIWLSIAKKKKNPDMTYIQYITTYTISTSINILDSLLHKPKKTAQVTWGLYYTTKTEKIWMTKFHTATLKILHSLLKSEKVTLVQKLVQVAYNQENSICTMYMLIQPQKHKHQSQVSSSHITTQKEASIYS